MKGRNWLALLLALVLTLGLCAPALAAEVQKPDFSDVGDNWSWAWPSINKATAAGLFQGYQDGRFGPADPITQATGLTLLARLMVHREIRERILQDRLGEMRTILPSFSSDPDDPAYPYVWFRNEAAACLEMGVVDAATLRTLYSENRLGAPMTRADFAVYLVRAMGLDDLAASLGAGGLSFADTDAIDESARPYIKLLVNLGVVNGDTANRFNPQDSLNRAQCATMLIRAKELVLEERGLSLELPRYDVAYPFVTGYIREVTKQDDDSRTVVLESPVSGLHEVTVPASAAVYELNLTRGFTALKVGAFAKVCYELDGKAVSAVRVTPADRLSTVQGPCDGLQEFSVTVDGFSYELDRFTEVSAGGVSGDWQVIDLDAGYSGAEVTFNASGRVAYLKLTGGSRLMEGILTDVTAVSGRTTATVNSFAGAPAAFDVTDLLAGDPDRLQKSHEGLRVTYRVDNDDPTRLVSLEVDLLSRYLQGVLEAADPAADPRKADITVNGVAFRYDLTTECPITYDGAAATLESLPAGAYVTGKLEGGVLTALSAWPSTRTVEGALISIQYTDPTTLEVAVNGGETARFSVPNDKLREVTVTRDGAASDVTTLLPGDTLTLTLRYHVLSHVVATSKAPDVTGTLATVATNEDGSSVLTLRLADGTTQVYRAGADVPVTRDDARAALSDLKPSLRVAVVTDGDRALAIQILGADSRQERLEGTLYQREGRVLTILVGADAQPVRVNVPYGAKLVDAATGEVTDSPDPAAVNDSLEVFGVYGADNVFQARVIIKLPAGN